MTSGEWVAAVVGLAALAIAILGIRLRDLAMIRSEARQAHDDFRDYADTVYARHADLVRIQEQIISIEHQLRDMHALVRETHEAVIRRQ